MERRLSSKQEEEFRMQFSNVSMEVHYGNQDLLKMQEK